MRNQINYLYIMPITYIYHVHVHICKNICTLLPVYTRFNPDNGNMHLYLRDFIVQADCIVHLVTQLRWTEYCKKLYIIMLGKIFRVAL